MVINSLSDGASSRALSSGLQAHANIARLPRRWEQQDKPYYSTARQPRRSRDTSSVTVSTLRFGERAKRTAVRTARRLANTGIAFRRLWRRRSLQHCCLPKLGLPVWKKAEGARLACFSATSSGPVNLSPHHQSPCINLLLQN